MDDEEVKFRTTVERLQESDPALALQVLRHGQMRSRFNRLHRQRFCAITKLDGFQRVNLVHFRRGTSVVVDDVAMDGPADENPAVRDDEAMDGPADENPAVGDDEDDTLMDPELLHADDEDTIAEGVELMMYIAEDDV